MGLNLTSSIAFFTGTVWLVVWEIVGIQRKGHGDTITENYRFLDHWLHLHSPWVDWAFRIFTIGFTGWMSLHFIVGAR